MNGEGSVHIDRGNWLYRFVLGTDSIAIYRSTRSGQNVVSADVWRCLAVLGISDVFILPVSGGWQPVVELAEGRRRWALERRTSMAEAEAAARYFLSTLADTIAHASQVRCSLVEGGPDSAALRVPEPPEAPPEGPAVMAALAEACASRDGGDWHLIYSRERALR